MNFLAHLYLSGNNDQICIGNFIADWVKGSHYELYPDIIRKGILVHRSIDDFTDHNPIVLRNARLFKSGFGHYASVVIDVVYDYFLANLWDNYSTVSLHDFATSMYGLLLRSRKYMPLPVNRMIPFLIESNRLVSYRSIEGIRSSLAIMARNTSLPEKHDYAIDVILKNEEQLAYDFIEFFEQIKEHISQTHGILLPDTSLNGNAWQSLSA